MIYTTDERSLRPLMLAGTGSDVGKSVINAGLCRILKQDGYNPAPFKAQNMALNSFVTPDGLEIGRAQAVQAEACGILCQVEMNPILLKPSSDHTSQVVLMGKPIGNCDAYEYFRREGRDELRQVAHHAFDILAADYAPIVLEGAGSVAELNLSDTDLVNMSMAEYADAAVLLVTDIDRGGVFASAYGSIHLLPEHHRRLIKGIVINKFRGDRKLFDDGCRILEDICGVPVVGVLPYFTDIDIEEEDSVSLSRKERKASESAINVAVVRLAHISNFTDFDLLGRVPGVHLFYTDNVDQIAKSDVVILPGSKSTVADLDELRCNGVAEAVLRAADRGAVVLGVCGGYQMMGIEVADPLGLEGSKRTVPGLGLLPIRTEIKPLKTTRQTSFTLCPDETCTGEGYEIHQGVTTTLSDAVLSPLCRLSDGSIDGYFLNERCMGTYLHGILDNPSFVSFLLLPFADRSHGQVIDYRAYKETQYDKLAMLMREHLDMDYIYQLIHRHIQ